MSMSWNQEIATQIAIAAQDKNSATINIWDLRKPNQPFQILN